MTRPAGKLPAAQFAGNRSLVENDADRRVVKYRPECIQGILDTLIKADHDDLGPGLAECFRRNRARVGLDTDLGRSEEHTSELQSLMRISYAVFCLKKKHKHTNTPQQIMT